MLLCELILLIFTVENFPDIYLGMNFYSDWILVGLSQYFKNLFEYGSAEWHYSMTI